MDVLLADTPHRKGGNRNNFLGIPASLITFVQKGVQLITESFIVGCSSVSHIKPSSITGLNGPCFNRRPPELHRGVQLYQKDSSPTWLSGKRDFSNVIIKVVDLESPMLSEFKSSSAKRLLNALSNGKAPSGVLTKFWLYTINSCKLFNHLKFEFSKLLIWIHFTSNYKHLT